MHKQQKVKSLKKHFLVGFFILISLVIPINSASALPNSVLRMFLHNNILGYDDEELNSCTNTPRYATGVDPGTRYVSNRNDHGHWDGTCYTLPSNYIKWVESQLEYVQNVAAKNGLPWEILLAQTLGESSGGQNEVCSHNPLGLKNFGSAPPSTCDSKQHAAFNSYEEAWQWYVDGIQPIRTAKNKFPQDPYSFVEYIEYNDPSHVYAVSSVYVQKISEHICAIQRWAKENNIATSAVTSENFFNAKASDESPQDILNTVVTVSNNSALCPQNSNTSSIYSGSDIAQAALSLAWPYRGNRDGGELGMCDPDGSGNLIPFDSSGNYTQNNCRNNPKPAYAQALEKFNIGNSKDCGHFVASVILTAGIDPNFPKAGTENIQSYMSSTTDIWQEVSVDNLQPGDVVWRHGHILIYVGEAGGEWGNVTQASLGTTVGVTSKRSSFGGEYRAYRVKNTASSGKLTSGGMTYAEAQTFMQPYINKANETLNVHSDVTFEGAQIHGTNCKYGTLNNCVAFSQWFVNRYTTANIVNTSNGNQFVNTLLNSGQGFINGGNIPRPYAIFSFGSYNRAGWGSHNHTGVVMGVDEKNDKIIIAEAGCGHGSPDGWKYVSELKLSDWTNQSGLTYAYTDDILDESSLR